MTSTASIVPPARAVQLENVVTKWYKDFEQPIGKGITREDFVSSYHPEVQWFDHAFHVCRVGHDAVVGLSRAWLHCNQPFHADLKVTGAHPIVESVC